MKTEIELKDIVSYLPYGMLFQEQKKSYHYENGNPTNDGPREIGQVGCLSQIQQLELF